MLLTLDVGNTQITFAIAEKGQVVHQWRMATDVRRSWDEYGVMLLQMLKQFEVNPKAISRVVMSTVVPDIHYTMTRVIDDYLGVSMRVVGLGDLQVPLKVNLDNPEEVGADRLVGAYAATKLYASKNVAVVDFGTATTLDVVTKEGVYEGGIIAPGVKLSLHALESATAKLPGVLIRRPKAQKVTGKNTVHAMQSGLYYGYLSMIDGLLARLKEEHAIDHVVATGGLASLYVAESEHINDVVPDLVMLGLVALGEE